ncbi:hypothetical protein MATL_G00240200 [Megalops atlanticus]|uniref:Nucleolin n=1 Tax=Megalops atlanticus TaxID=7932 RepID=A0A9D3PCB4_MEGAT|nr:hypothetical protein MATL_G00240200 [Megalops atlanticus]
MVKLVKAEKKAKPQKKAPPPPKEEDEEEELSEEEAPPKAVAKKKATPAKAAKNGKVAKKQESKEDKMPPPAKKGKATPAKAKPVPPKKAAPVEDEESEEEDGDDDDEDEEESDEEAAPPKATPGKPAVAAAAKNGKAAKKQESKEDEMPPPAKKGKATPAKTKPAPPKKAAPVEDEESEEEEDDDDDDEEESEEEAAPPKTTPAKPPMKAAPAEEEDDDDDDDDDDDEEDEDEEEEMDTTPAPVTKEKKAGMVKAKEESEDEDDEEDEDDDEEEEESGDDEPASTPGKRKAKAKEAPPAKKAKTEDKGFCLFVGNLNTSKSFEEIKQALTDFFSKNDLEVQDVRVGSSKKFGYVDFATEEDLQKALELNNKKVLGQELRLDKAKSKETSQDGKRDRDARTLFVKNLPYSATKEDLQEIFDQAVEIRIPTGNNGSSRGIAYVEFKSEAIAEQMLKEKQGLDVQGRSVIVDFTGDKSQKGSRPSAAGAVSKTLVVNNLAYSASEETLQSVFEKAVSIRIVQSNGRPKGFAFVEFENVEDATEALESMNNTEVEGRSVRLEYSQSQFQKPESRGPTGPTKTLFVKGLSEETTDETLRDSFEGAIAARVATDKDTGSSKGFGFVDFESEESCKAAKEAMEDCEIDGSKVTLDYARPKGEGGHRGGRGGGFGGRGGGGRGGRGGFGRGGGGFRGGRGGRGGNRGGFGGRGGGFGGKPQGKKTKFED